MKRFLPICLLILLAAAVWVSGCTMRETSVPVPAGQNTEATPAPSAEPTAEPTPSPSPIPFDLVAENTEPRYKWLDSYDELFDVMDSLRADSDMKDHDEAASFSGASISTVDNKGDIMARNSDILYILSDKDLVIVRLAGEGTQEMSRTSIGTDWGSSDNGAAVTGSEKTPVEVLCQGDRLAVVSDWYGYESSAGIVNYTEYTAVDIFDVSDPAAPRRMAELGQGGTLHDAGISDGCLYLITEFSGYEESVRENINGYVPAAYSGGIGASLPPEKICLAQDGVFPGCSVIGIYSLDQPQCVDVRALAGVKADACSKDGHICFFSARQTDSLSRILTNDSSTVSETAQIACTDLFLFDFDSDALTLSRAGTVNGLVYDSGCMDLRDGNLLCLTHLRQRLYTDPAAEGLSWDETTEGSALYVLDRELHVTEKFTPGDGSELLHWAGFLGDTVILSDPDRGSSYCIYTGGNNDPVQLEDCVNAAVILPWGENGFAAFRPDGSGKLVLAVYDDSMALVDRRSFGSDHSNTLDNIQCYFSDAERNIISFSADDSYCFYGISDQGQIEHHADFYLDDWAWNARAMILGDRLYVADRNEIIVLDPADLTELARMPL